MKRAIMRVSNEVIRQSIRIPDGVKIERIVPHDANPEFDESLFILSGDDLPDTCETKDGEPYPLITMKLRNKTYVVFNGWIG